MNLDLILSVTKAMAKDGSISSSDFDEVVDALKKQLSRPALAKENYNGAEFCPMCSEYLGQRGDRDLYCPWCGQRIGDDA